MSFGFSVCSRQGKGVGERTPARLRLQGEGFQGLRGCSKNTIPTVVPFTTPTALHHVALLPSSPFGA